MLVQQLWAKLEPHEDPLLCGCKAVVCFNRIEDAISPIISLDTAGLWRWVWEAGISKTIVNQSSAIVFFSDRAYHNSIEFFISIVHHNSIEFFISIVHALRKNLAASRNFSVKWRPPIEADYGSDTAKQEFFIRL